MTEKTEIIETVTEDSEIVHKHSAFRYAFADRDHAVMTVHANGISKGVSVNGVFIKDVSDIQFSGFGVEGVPQCTITVTWPHVQCSKGS